MELVKVNKTDNTALARDVYDFVFVDQKNKTSFSHWFSRAVNKYGFEEEKDFQSFLTKSNGGRPIIDYVVTFDMAKELCMVSPTKNGSKARKYFLKCEKIAKETYAQAKGIELAAKETRKSLTDAVEEYGENERMHGHGFSTYTLMVYKLLGIKDQYRAWKKTAKKGDDFRITLEPDLRKRVATTESMVKSMLELGNEYDDIKATIEPLFEVKEIK